MRITSSDFVKAYDLLINHIELLNIAVVLR